MTLNKKMFVAAASKIHSNKYSYANSVYKNTSTKLEIVCPDHGGFYQRAADHMNGTGCPQCGIAARIKYRTIKEHEFLKKANEKFNSKFSYSKAKYRNYSTSILITCPTHGDFWQTPASHVSSKHGCLGCAGKKQLTASAFIKYAANKHNNKYCYAKVVYENTNKKVCIVCSLHGDFWQTPDSHKRGAGCPSCADNQSLSLSEFIRRASAKHNNKYTYDNAKYTNSKSTVTVRCKEHGHFNQIANNHLMGAGCPACSLSYGQKENEWLDSKSIAMEHRQHKITFSDGSYVIADGYDPTTNTVYEFWGDYWHGNPSVYNMSDFNVHNSKTFGELFSITQDKIQKYKTHGYHVVDTWETPLEISSDYV